MHLSRLFILLVFTLSVLGAGYTVASEREYALKAGFVYNFARYSEGWWFKPVQETEYRICSNDADFVSVATQTLQSQSIKNRPVVLQLVSEPEPGCHSLYISDKQPFVSVNKISDSVSSMLIGEGQDFIEKGGHISFFIAGGKIRFQVSPGNLRRTGIQMSSKVLRLGRVIGGS